MNVNERIIGVQFASNSRFIVEDMHFARLKRFMQNDAEASEIQWQKQHP